MPSASHSVTINRSASEVFAFVADGENAPRWRSGVLDIQRVSGHGVGAVYRQGVRGPAGRRIAADYEVTAYQPDRLLALKTIAGPVRPLASSACKRRAAPRRLRCRCGPTLRA